MFKLLLLSFITIFYLLHFSNYSYGQTKNPVTWEFHSGKIANNLYEVDLQAHIPEGWHIYPCKMGIDEIGIPTTIMFVKTPYFKMVDTIEEKGSLQISYDGPSGITSRYYENSVIFSQYFSLKGSSNKITVEAIVQWQCCTKQMCLPAVSKLFSIIINRE